MNLNFTVEIKFIIFQLLIIAPFLIGLKLRKKISNPSEFSKKLIRINIYFNEPVIVIWSIWGLTLSKDFFILPLFGLLLVFSGFVFGKFSAKFLTLDKKSETAFTISSSISNHGFTMGSFICYLLISETGLGLSSIFILYFIPFIYIFIFPYAQLIHQGKKIDIKAIRGMVLNFQNMPLVSIIAALILQVSSIPRPEIFFPVEIFLVLLCAIYYFTLGISFEFGGLKSIWREQLILSLIKFIALPATAYIILQFINLDINVKFVILIQSFMPAGIYTVMTSILFDLNPGLSSSLFIVNTVLFILVIMPLLFLMKGMLFF